MYTGGKEGHARGLGGGGGGMKGNLRNEKASKNNLPFASLRFWDQGHETHTITVVVLNERGEDGSNEDLQSGIGVSHVAEVVAYVVGIWRQESAKGKTQKVLERKEKQRSRKEGFMIDEGLGTFVVSLCARNALQGRKETSRR